MLMRKMPLQEVVSVVDGGGEPGVVDVLLCEEDDFMAYECWYGVSLHSIGFVAFRRRAQEGFLVLEFGRIIVLSKVWWCWDGLTGGTAYAGA